MPSLLRKKNDRREIRKAIKMKCHVVRERDFTLISEKIVDLSPDGMLVTTDVVDVQPGERVFVTFRATNLDLWFDTEAAVMRIVRGRREGDRERGLGLRFSTLPGVKRLILRGHLRRIPPPLPRRAQRIDWTATVRSIDA
jgi:hypothetical protein